MGTEGRGQEQGHKWRAEDRDEESKQDSECSPQSISSVQKSARKAGPRPSSQGGMHDAATLGTRQRPLKSSASGVPDAPFSMPSSGPTSFISNTTDNTLKFLRKSAPPFCTNDLILLFSKTLNNSYVCITALPAEEDIKGIYSLCTHSPPPLGAVTT